MGRSGSCDSFAQEAGWERSGRLVRPAFRTASLLSENFVTYTAPVRGEAGKEHEVTMKQSVSLVTIAVNDFEKELAFYQEVLGWKPYNVVDGVIAFFPVGSFILSLCSYRELRDDVGPELTTEPYLGFTLAQNVPSEAVVDEVFAQLRDANTTIVKEPKRASWGGYSGYFADPEGHLWEIAYNPQFTYDSDGVMIVPE